MKKKIDPKKKKGRSPVDPIEVTATLPSKKEMANQAEESENSQTLFYISHELRSPLMSIRSGLELLKRRVDEADIIKVVAAFKDLYPQFVTQLERLDKITKEVLETKKFSKPE